MIDYTATYTDLYQLAMAQVYLESGQKEHRAVFDYFFRKLPFGSGYAVFAGLNDLLDILENFHFDETDISYLRQQGFHHDFLTYLKDFRFNGDICSSLEGDVVFPIRPVLQVEATLMEAQIVETILLNVLNFQTLIATKAMRIRMISGDRTLIDFGLRRAQGPAGYYASRAAAVGGFNATSNVRAGRDYGIPISGTMAHAFVQSYDDELAAFREFAARRPHDCVLLVDTYNTLLSGVPNAITVARELEEQGHRLAGIRLDSGDLAWLAAESRRMLDAAGLHYVKIAASNQLDEYIIKSLLEQQAPIDVFGVGTSMVIGRPDGALDGVYKLAFSNGKPRIKVSETPGKTTLPHKKQVFRLRDSEGHCIGADAVALADENTFTSMHHPLEPEKSMSVGHLVKEPLLKLVMRAGKRTAPPQTLDEIARYSRQRVDDLPPEYKRFENPHIYKVGLTAALKQERDNLIEWHKSSSKDSI